MSYPRIEDARPALTHVTGGIAYYQPGDVLPRRTLRDFEFVWIIAGDIVWHCDGKEHQVGPDSVILCRPGMSDSFTWDTRSRTRHAFFHFNLQHLTADWPAPETWPIIAAMPADDPVRPMFRHILSRWCHRDDRSVQTPPPAIARLVLAMIDCYLSLGEVGRRTASRQLPEPVQRVIDAVFAKLMRGRHEPMTLDQLAKVAKVSPGHLTRLFRQSLGVTPVKAVQYMRLQQAMTLLERSHLNVSQVADRCGFATPYHFSRVFTEAYNIPPSRIRARLADGQPRPPSPLPVDAPLPFFNS